MFSSRFFHFHFKCKCASKTKSTRRDHDLTAATLHDFFHYRESKPNAFAVLVCSPLQFSKFGEKQAYVFSIDPCACVIHLYYQTLCYLIVACQDLYGALTSELFGILDQVDQNLLEASFISINISWQRTWYVLACYIFVSLFIK